MERGKSRGVEHLSTEKLKQITNYDNIKYELEHEEVKPVETKNMALIVAQNKELIKYTNKLKQHLAKSYQAINEIQTIQQENTSLKQENQILRNENNNLRNYIEKSFEVVKHLFDFPIDRFRRLINSFIEDISKEDVLK